MKSPREHREHVGWWWSQNWRKSRLLLRAGAVAFTLLAGATAAALILAHYSGFDSWPDLLSGDKGTNAGSASLQSGPASGGNGSFLNLGPGGLPFAPGAGGTATLPPPGVAPAGTGLFIVDGGGPDGNGEGNGGNGNNGGNPGGATTGPGQGGPGAPAGPGAPGGTPQPPSGGEPPGGGPGTGGPGTTPGGGGDDGEEPSPPSKPDGGDGDCNDGKGQATIASSESDDGEKWATGASGGKDFEEQDFEEKDFDEKDFEEKDFEDQDFGDKSETSLEPQHKASEPAYGEAESYAPPPAETEAAVSEIEEAVPPPPVNAPSPEVVVVQETDPESIPAPLPAD